MHAIVVMDLHLLWFSGGCNLMSFIDKVPIRNAENHKDWIRKVHLAFVCADLDWVLKEPQPVQPEKLVRDEKDNDEVWAKKERDYALLLY
jgi:hypothetical protein